MFSGTNNYVIYNAGSPSDKKRRIYDGSNCAWGSNWHRMKITYGHTYCHHFLLVAQQFVSTLLLLLHLGLLELFFGGTIISGLEADSVTKEWTGLIGQNFRHLTTHTWIVLIPIAFIV